MRKKLTRTGNSVAVVLDKALLEELGLDEDSTVELSSDGQVILISKVPDKKREARLREVMSRVDARYAGVFKKLAE